MKLTNPEIQDLVESYIMPVVLRNGLFSSKHEWEIRKEMKIAVRQFNEKAA